MPSLSRMSLVLLVSACAACSPVWIQGKRLADAGRFEEASRFWMAALDEDMDAPPPHKGLNLYGPAAVALHVDLAEDHEREQRYEAALQEYDAAEALASTLLRYDADPGLDLTELQRVREDVNDAWFAYRVQQGDDAAARAEWRDAITWWDRALTLHPDTHDLDPKRGDAHREAGMQGLEQRRYADAYADLKAATQLHPDPIARAWADSVGAALGRYYLHETACRAAVILLREVAETSADPLLAEDIARAEDCARVELLFTPVAVTSEVAAAPVDIGGRVTDRLAEAVTDRSSAFLVVLDRSLVDDTPPAVGRRFTVNARLSQLTNDHDDSATETIYLQGTRRAPCPPPEYPTYQVEMCDEAVALTYTLHTTSEHALVSGSVRITEPKTGVVVMTRSLEAHAAHESRHRSPFLDPNGEEVEVGATPSETVTAVPPDALTLATTATPLPSPTALLTEASDSLTTAAANAILAAIDVTPTPPTPSRLSVVTPLIDAAELEFSQPDPHSDAPSRVVIPQ